MSPRIRLKERSDTGELTREIVVTREEFVIGRGPDCDLRLPEDDVSRHHCSIHSPGDEPLLLDLGSANGTSLNGQRIRSQSVLHSRDEIMLGVHIFIVLLGDDELSQLSEAQPDAFRATRRLPMPGSS